MISVYQAPPVNSVRQQKDTIQEIRHRKNEFMIVYSTKLRKPGFYSLTKRETGAVITSNL